MTSVARHRLRLGDTEWSVWRDVLLRSAGFPLDGLARFAAPRLAAAVDDWSQGRRLEDLGPEFARVLADQSGLVRELLDDRCFHEALVWEHSSLLNGVDERKIHQRPDLDLALQWQRYCASNNTIGFFGPMLWLKLDKRKRRSSLAVGKSVIARRVTVLSPWALAALGTAIASRPGLRAWLPPSRHPHHWQDGGRVHISGRSHLELSRLEAAVYSRCDGRTPAVAIGNNLVTDGLIAEPDEVHEILSGLQTRGLVTWDTNLPAGWRAERVLGERIRAIGDQQLRTGALEDLGRLRKHCAWVARAAGDPDRVRSAHAGLDRTFRAITGVAPLRRGMSYPGSSVCYEETERGGHVVLGLDTLDELAAPLRIALQSVRWLTAELAAAFEHGLAAELRRRGRTVTELDAIWPAGLRLLLGDGTDSVVEVLRQEYARRWRAAVLEGRETGSRAALTSPEVSAAVDRLFPAREPGWPSARLHSPDLLFCADSAEAIAEGNYLAVLGELHIAFATSGLHLFTPFHKDPLRLQELAVKDCLKPRYVPLLPRLMHTLAGHDIRWDETSSDRILCMAKAPGVELHKTVPAGRVRIERSGDAVIGWLPDGSIVPVAELFGQILSMSAVDLFQNALAGHHIPRVTVDRLVLWRETWRLRHEEVCRLETATDDFEFYVRARELAARLSLPEHCFARISPHGGAPLYVDFTSPVYLLALRSELQRAAQCGMECEVILTEMLPDLTDSWLVDHEGRRYTAEFRLQMTDTLWSSPS